MKSEVADEIVGVVVAVAVAGFMLAAMYATVASFLDTGPNCPGMDPEFIGWCER